MSSLHRAREMPKSASLAMPSSVTRMFSGVTSPCTTPLAWAVASASAICQPIAAACSGLSGPSSATMAARLREGTYSMTSQLWPASSMWSKTATMCGWCRRAALRASLRSRPVALASSMRAHLRATVRSSSRS
ncbi:hypothetical protein NYE86_19240 [Actinacidiphila bryophytorum]|nr:hypothetical protein [Actinacidiphila bryophytorum]UWE10634.1 hypothetical protein NYE86_19240 [Actinacidiphila bryophytorum]